MLWQFSHKHDADGKVNKVRGHEQPGQVQGTAPPPAAFTQQQLDELLAPIALYPDPLLSQVLMASTYPLEVIEADRWLKQNPGLTGTALDEALKNQPWDVSVKSLCHFPQVLSTMDDKISQTTALGNAFLEQQNQVMDTIQKLRARAQAQGNLNSMQYQNATVQNGDIAIQPVSPEVIYVPAYNPCWVYGPWWYGACAPPWFWNPSLAFGFFWGVGFFVGPLDFWCGFNWHGHAIFVNTNKTFFVRRAGATGMHGGVETWRHNPVHRRGVAYHNAATAERFGRAGAPGAEPRRAFRGFEPSGRGQAPSRGGETARPGGASPGAFHGFGNGVRSQQQSSRGNASMSARPQGAARVSSGGRGGGSAGGFHGGGGGHGR